MKPLLSKKAIRVLEDNGYKYKQSDEFILFRKSTEYISIIVVSVIGLIIAFPLFIFNTFLGILTLLLVAAGIVFRYKYYSKKMVFSINLKTQKFNFLDHVIELENQSLSFASKIILHSRFKDEYTSAFKNTSEEHHITIGMELLSGSMFTIFRFYSDYSKPSEEMLEVYKLVKKLIHFSKKKEAESKQQTALP